MGRRLYLEEGEIRTTTLFLRIVQHMKQKKERKKERK
jgi:hypothetical protein